MLKHTSSVITCKDIAARTGKDQDDFPFQGECPWCSAARGFRRGRQNIVSADLTSRITVWYVGGPFCCARIFLGDRVDTSTKFHKNNLALRIKKIMGRYSVDIRIGFKIFSSFLGGLVFLTGVSAQEINRKHVEIVAFGASQTAGKGVSETEAYPARVEALLRADGFDVSVTNQGVNADTVTDELRRIESAIPPSTRIVLFQPGTNDCARRNRIGESDFAAVLDRTMAWMQARHLQVIVLNSNCYHDATQSMVGKYGFVDYGNVLQGGLGEFKSDGQHLTAEGYQKLATFLLPSIEKLLKDDNAATPSNGS